MSSSISAATSLIEDVTALFEVIREGRDNYRRATTNSVTQAAAQNTIRSRVYIDKGIANDPVVPSILKAAQTMYCGMILMVLKMQYLVTESSTVSQSIAHIRTAGMEEYVDVAAQLDSILQAGVEAVDDDANSAPAKAPKSANDIDESDITIASPDQFPTGKIIEVTLNVPNNPGETIRVPLMIVLTPYIVNSDVMTLMVTHGASLSFKQRFLQWKAGEISFVSDLLFQNDRLRKLEKAVRGDTTGTFSEYLRDVAEKDKATLSDNLAMAAHSNPMRSNNIANTIMVISSDTARMAKMESHVDLDNPSARARFFKNTYVMMVFVVDQNFNTVRVYMNGVKDVGEYSFDQFSSKKKNGDSVDLMAFMSAISGNRAPSF